MRVHRRTLVHRLLVAMEDFSSSVFSMIRLAAERFAEGFRVVGRAVEDLIGSLFSWARRR